MEIKYKVWCEFWIDGELHKKMESPASWFLLSQEGKLWEYSPTEPPRPLLFSDHKNFSHCYKKAIPIFYTGFYNKYGEDIFDGDILQTISHHGEKLSRFQVRWNEKFGRWEKIREDGRICNMDRISESNKITIGNIYENPELRIK